MICDLPPAQWVCRPEDFQAFTPNDLCDDLRTRSYRRERINRLAAKLKTLIEFRDVVQRDVP